MVLRQGSDLQQSVAVRCGRFSYLLRNTGYVVYCASSRNDVYVIVDAPCGRFVRKVSSGGLYGRLFARREGVEDVAGERFEHHEAAAGDLQNLDGRHGLWEVAHEHHLVGAPD